MASLSIEVKHPAEKNPWILFRGNANRKTAAIKFDTSGVRWILGKGSKGPALGWHNLLAIEAKRNNKPKTRQRPVVKTISLIFGGRLKTGKERIVYIQAASSVPPGRLGIGSVVMTVAIGSRTVRLARKFGDIDKAAEMTWEEFGDEVMERLGYVARDRNNRKYLPNAREARP